MLVRRVEQRATGQFLLVQGPAGIVISMAGWMFDPVHCAGMTIGPPRVDVAALIELERLLSGAATPHTSGAMSESFRRKTMEPLKRPAAVPGRQMSFLFERQQAGGPERSGARQDRRGAGADPHAGRAASASRSLTMTSAELFPAAILKRKAVVYVRQSTQSQVMTNLESKRRQYDLVDVARQRGFVDVEVIDDDLGRSASGTVARPGFERLVAWLCAGKVGAVLCFDASRLARNGRDWHHLLELCGLVEARVIDHDGVYNPCRPNDRLLLGMKGSISEFELGVLRARMLDAARSKAGRGELRISVPFGYIWHREAGLGLDPDLRLQEVIRLIFARFQDLGSARQVLLSMTAERIHFPRPSDEGRMTSFEWRPIRYRNVIAVLKNPFYAGVYVYGKSEKRTCIVEGQGAAELRAWQAARHVGGDDQGSSRRLHRLAGVRAEPEAACPQRLRPSRGRQIRPWRAGAPVRGS